MKWTSNPKMRHTLETRARCAPETVPQRVIGMIDGNWKRRLSQIFGWRLGWLIFVSFASVHCWPQSGPTGVHIQGQFDQAVGQLPPIWNYFGYDEPNYSYSLNGKKLLRGLAALDAAPVYVRVHNLLTSGDGTASLKWGSTNVYTEDPSGRPIYSWTILDRIFDAFHPSGLKPLVEIGFMPEVLSSHPKPYRHDFPRTPVSEIYTGWAYPPKDYGKWSELVFQFVHHLRERYGDAEVKTWLWEVWNEPDIDYWKGTREEFFKLYDVTIDATLRVLPEARIGGPDSTGPGNSKAADFLRAFLEHLCARQELRERWPRLASGLHQFPSQGIAHLGRRPRSDGNPTSACCYRRRLQHRCFLSAVANDPDCSRRVRPGGLRSVFRHGPSPKLLSQRAAVRRLHRRGYGSRAGVSRGAAHQRPRCRDMGFRI